MSVKRIRDNVYTLYNLENWTHKGDEKYDRIECKKCKSMILKHATHLKRHSRKCEKSITLQTTIVMFKEKQIDKELLDLIIENNLSLRVVESSSFQKFCKALNKNYKTPSTKTLKKMIQTESDRITK